MVDDQGQDKGVISAEWENGQFQKYLEAADESVEEPYKPVHVYNDIQENNDFKLRQSKVQPASTNNANTRPAPSVQKDTSNIDNFLKYSTELRNQGCEVIKEKLSELKSSFSGLSCSGGKDLNVIGQS